MIERIDPAQVVGESQEAVRAHIESDFRIRQGLCPNGCGLLAPDDGGQACPACGFWTNKLAEPVQAQ